MLTMSFFRKSVNLLLWASFLLINCNSVNSSQETQNFSIEEIHGENEDELTNYELNSRALEDVINEHKVDDSGSYFPEKVISTISPAVIRQNNSDGESPRYQEGLGYSFLLHDPLFPGLTQMDDGTLVLTLTTRHVDLELGGEELLTEVILFSRDDGISWSQPSTIPGFRTKPMNLGGQRLMLRGWISVDDTPDTYRMWFSDDGGITWSDPEEIHYLPDGRWVATDVAPTMLIEGDIVRFLFYTFGNNPDVTPAITVEWPYNHVLHTWGTPHYFDGDWGDFARTSEASMTRAANGDLVASFRSHRIGIPFTPDHWRSIVTARSTDDGETWSWPEVHSLYGHVHSSLLTFPDERILMTYAARIGELDGRMYHGHEAVFSYDNGETWDWEHRFILFRGTGPSMHSPQSVLLSDGRVLTIFMHPILYTWQEDGISNKGTQFSNVSVRIWSPDF